MTSTTHTTEPATAGTTTPARGLQAIPPGVEYHRVLAGEKRRVGRGILAIFLLLGGMTLFSILLPMVASLIDAQMGRVTPFFGGTDYTPLYHGSAMASVALLIPWSMLIQRWLYKVPGASLHSVISHFRFDLFARSLLLIAPLVVAVLLVSDYLAPQEQTIWAHTDILWLFALTLVLTPLQSAGEEYGFRGLIFRIAGSWGRGPRTGLFLGVLVSSLAFAFMHLATDPWLNLWYLVFGVSTALITWRTGGIEIAVVMHAVFNTIAFALDFALGTDQVQAGDRATGAANAVILIPAGLYALIAAVVLIRKRRSGPALTPSGPTE